MASVTLDSGVEIAYQRAGSADGNPLLLLHGMGESHRDLLSFSEHFAASYSIVMPDLPGHGDSPTYLFPVTIEAIGSTLVDFCHALGLTSVAVAGHSLGAAIATSLAAQAPDLVSRLVLLDPGMVLTSELKQNLVGFYASITPETFESVLRASLPAMIFGENDDPEVVDQVMESMIRLGPDQFQLFGHSVVAFDSEPAVQAVTAPTLLAITAAPMVDAGWVAKHAPAWQIVQFDELSHQGLVLDRDVAELCHTFLSGTDV
jgi:pimeloyl-ACP methyl ester carboxylesterase